MGCLLSLLVVASVGAVALYQVTRRLPTIEELGLSSAATRIYSDDGVLLARIYRENRDYVHLKDIPQGLQDATVAIEDDRFYTHAGLDLRGIGRAVVSNVRGGRLGQGGSTITQQLARNAYDLGKQKTFGRKLQEAVVAIRLEKKYSKKEILEGYLNEVYYGAKAYGVQAAAMEYFGKPASRLTLAESAMIAGLPQRPTEYNPFKNKDAAQRRRDVVLARMAELGYITAQQSDAAQNEPIHLAPRRLNATNEWKAPYFVDYTMRLLEERYGVDTVYRGGLVVRTTLNYAMQQAAETAVREGVADAIRYHLASPHAQCALTCVDPHNGYVRAMVGGLDWRKSQFNRAINNTRQPGSTYKLFVYTSALNEGWSQYRTVNDSPKSWKRGNGRWWSPKNYDHRWRGPITLRRAVALSVNMVAIKVAEAVGIRKSIELARKLGLRGDLQPYLATAIGAGGASTMELASAYGAFAAKGKYVPANPILQVKDRDGNVLEESTPQAIQVVDPAVANSMNDMLRAVVTEGTGRVAGAIPDSFGKTGTTQDLRDAWFVGFTPALSTAVWMGTDRNEPMPGASGGHACAPIWVRFMKRALEVNPRNRLDVTSPPSVRPDGPDVPVPTDAQGEVVLKICPDSGLIATNHCPHWHTVHFKPGEAPTRACDIHTGTPLNPEAVRQKPTPVQTTEGAASPASANSPPAETAEPSNPPASGASAETTAVFCADTGLRANAYCPRTVTRRVTPTSPTATCTVHGPNNPG